MTEAAANKKLYENEKEYFRLGGKSQTHYACVIKKSNDYDLFDDYAIEIGLEDFSLHYDLAKRKLLDVLKTEGVKEETHNDIDNNEVIHVDSKHIGLQSEPRYIKKLNELTGGCSISYNNNGLDSGTGGAFFKMKNSHSIYLLSNRHVMVNNNVELGTKITHPSRADARNQYDQEEIIGNVIWTSKKKSSITDAAIAKIYSDDFPVAIGKYTLSKHFLLNDIGIPKIGQNVKKCGRTTGETYGKIRSINCTINITQNIEQPQFYRKQILTTYMTEPGDSGSVLINNSGEVVGLLFAGDEFKSSFANNINNIFNSDNLFFNAANFSKFL